MTRSSAGSRGYCHGCGALFNGGESHAVNAMPLVVYYRGGANALAHNGNLVNAHILQTDGKTASFSRPAG